MQVDSFKKCNFFILKILSNLEVVDCHMSMTSNILGIQRRSTKNLIINAQSFLSMLDSAVIVLFLSMKGKFVMP